MFILLLLLTSATWAKEISLLSLNLHGHHPMNESRRIVSSKNGIKEVGWSHLHHFKKEELLRGSNRRQVLLASHLTELAPDIIFLQEVGGGEINQKKDCTDFYVKNTAIDLSIKTNVYRSWSACRGNLGWWTNQDTFNDLTVYAESTDEVIYQKGDNPFPDAVSIEGLVILTSSKIKVLEHFQKNIPINSTKENFFLHGIRFSTGLSNKWMIAINIHGGHKVQHFEQAVATRLFISQYLSEQKDKELFDGLIIAGDFNAHESKKEVSTVPWSFHYRWQTSEVLERELKTLNSSSYKPFATLPHQEAQERITKSIKDLFFWFSLQREKWDGSLHEVSEISPCGPLPSYLNPHCYWDHKIDHIFVSENLKVENYSGIYKQNNWTDLAQTLSDHPGIWAIIHISK